MVKPMIITLFHTYRNIGERLEVISRAMEDIQKTKIELLEMKVTMCEMKTTLDGCNGIFDIAEKKTV